MSKAKTKAKTKTKTKAKNIRATFKTATEVFSGTLLAERVKESLKIGRLQKEYDKLSDKVARKQKQVNSYKKDLEYWEAHQKTVTYSKASPQRKAAVEKWIAANKAKVEKYHGERVELDRKRSAVRKQAIDLYTPNMFEAFTKKTTYRPETTHSTSYRAIKSDRVLKAGRIIKAVVSFNHDFMSDSKQQYSAGSKYYITITTDGVRKTSELLREHFDDDTLRRLNPDTDLSSKTLYDVEYIYTEERKTKANKKK